MTHWLEAAIVENRRWTDALFTLRVEGAPLEFEAGQFVRIALDLGGERGILLRHRLHALEERLGKNVRKDVELHVGIGDLG